MNGGFFKCLISMILTFSFWSCHYMVEDNFPEFKKIPVINCTLITDSIIRVQVSFTASLNDSVLQVVENAQVFIEGDYHAPEQLLYSNHGWYVSHAKALAGQHYLCKVVIPGFDTVWAETTMPEPSPIYGLNYVELAGMDEEGDLISSLCFFMDQNAGRTLYWEARMISIGMFHQIDYKTGDWTDQYGVKSHSIFMRPGEDQAFLNETSPQTLFSNKQITTSPYEIKFYFNRELKFNDKLDHYIELRSVSESYYRYHKQLYIYNTITYDEIGSMPQAYPFYTNVQNGLGIFSAFSISRIQFEPAQ